MRIQIRLAALLLMCFPLAEAQSPDALSAYVSGAYLEAVSISETAGGPDDLALAARAVLADALSEAGVNPEPAALQKAETLARAAVDLDPRHIEGRLQLAIAISLQARSMTTRQAMRSGNGEAARKLAEAVIEDMPTNHYAHAFMAVWHVEVIRRGGRVGGVVMGASVKRGRRHYRAAVESHADNAAVHWQWARVLASINAKKYRDEIDIALNASIGASPTDRLEQVMQVRAGLLKGKLETEPRKVVEAYAATQL